MQLFLQLLEKAAILFNPFLDYDVAGFEVHHREKKDAPSGTAIAISKLLLANLDRKKRMVNETVSPLEKEDLHFASLRAGHIVGEHSVTFDSPCDTLTFTHSAKNRLGFAEGAVLAAEWLKGKKGFYTWEEVLKNG